MTVQGVGAARACDILGGLGNPAQREDQLSKNRKVIWGLSLQSLTSIPQWAFNKATAASNYVAMAY